MIAFDIQDMTCGHCVATITRAVAAVDDRAAVRFDLPTHRVEIESSTASAQALSQSIQDAGYTPVAASSTPAAAASKKGCCCG
ncbi:heavy-metal-associated domain-containing protein [Variovorax sp. RHLX14]|uniref:heavy-metal-associated domain-containing protein n=1 Tax=Variovorax sp. RHLX14 TaxID=1259731 RepID=UPI003F46F2DA